MSAALGLVVFAACEGWLDAGMAVDLGFWLRTTRASSLAFTRA